MASRAIPAAPTKLGEYIEALIGLLGVNHPAALQRMRAVVGDRHARIVLDDEAVDVAFEHERLQVRPALGQSKTQGTIANVGATDSATVLDLLDGYLEAADSILDGRLRVSGAAEDVVRMLVAIEILLDASPRSPGLQALAFRFQRIRGERRTSPTPGTQGTWYPFPSQANEHELLARLDLLPEGLDTSPR